RDHRGHRERGTRVLPAFHEKLRRTFQATPIITNASRIISDGSGPCSTERSLTPAGIGSGWSTSTDGPAARTSCWTAMNDVYWVKRLYLRPSATTASLFASPW